MPAKAANKKKVIMVNGKPIPQPSGHHPRQNAAHYKKMGAKGRVKANKRVIAQSVPKLMKNLANMRLGSGKKGSKTIASGFANPSAFESGFRINVGDSNYTATANLASYQEHIVSTIANTSTLTPGHAQMFLYRDPCRAMVHFTGNSNRLYHCYQGYFYITTPTVTGEVSAMPLSHAASYLNFTRFKSLNNGTALPANTASGNVGWQPHGPCLYPGIISALGPNASFFYMGIGDSITINLASSDSGASFSVFRYVSPGANQNFVATMSYSSSATQTYTATTEGYYVIAVQDSSWTDTDTINSVYLWGNGDVFAHTTVPSFEEAPQIYSKARINAASILVHPTAAVLTISGVVTGNFYSSCAAHNWIDYIGKSPDVNLHYKETIGYEKGMYSFLPVDNYLSLYLQTNVSIDSTGALREANFVLDSPAGFVGILVSCTPTNTTPSVTPSLEYLVTTSHCVEYETADKTRSIAPCPYNHTDTMDAVDIVKKMRIFYENPLHLADIRNAVSSGYSKVSGFVGGAAKALGVAASIGRLIAPFLV